MGKEQALRKQNALPNLTIKALKAVPRFAKIHVIIIDSSWEETILGTFHDKSVSTPEEEQEILLSCIRQLNSNAKFENVMNHVLSSILRFYSGTRAYVFEFNWKQGTTSNTHEACAPFVTPEIDNLQNVPISAVDTWIRAFEHGEDCFILEDVDSLQHNPLRQEEYITLTAQGIQSLIAVPLRYNNQLHGFLGVDDPARNQGNSEFLINLTYFICNEMVKRLLNEELRKLSFSDYLTQFGNRNAYNAYLQQLADRHLLNTGILFADLNSLKYMNDTFGHEYGDQLICHMANVLRKHFSDHQIFRISGDEFVIICEHCTQGQFMTTVAQLRSDLTGKSEELASVGALWQREIFDLNKAVYQAEQLMYQNKQQYHAVSADRSQKQSDLIHLFLKNMELDRFEFYMQPQMDAQDGSVIGAEALVRRITHTGEVILPHEFIPILEKEMLISRLDFSVLDQVCCKLRCWLDQGLRIVPVSINFSSLTLREKDFISKFLDVCCTHAINPDNLIIEISRGGSRIDRETLKSILQTLHSHGIRVRVKNLTMENDFLAMITLDGVTAVKLDVSLVREMDEHFRVHLLIQALIDLCHRMGQVCMACGVETQHQIDLLRSMQCDSFQGFFFAHPMPADAFAAQYLKPEEKKTAEANHSNAATDHDAYQLPDNLNLLDSSVFDLLSQTTENLYIYLADLSKDFSRWSPAAVQYFGLPGEYIINTAKVWTEYIHPDDQHIFLEDMGRLIKGTSDRHDCEYRARNARGEYVWVRCNGIVQRNSDGTPGLFVGTMVNLRSVSKFDPTTGLLSSYSFLDYFQKYLASQGSGALLLFGIDHFKRINDVYGYQLGDQILHYVAQQVQMIPDCHFFRMDGDKIACLIPNGSRSDMELVFSQVCQILDCTPSIQDADFHLSASCGGVLYPLHGDQLEVLRANTEYALEQAKKNRRGSLAVYSEELHKKSVLSFQLQEILRSAISNNFEGFSLCYQPFINTETGEIFGAEALLRFSSPSTARVSPAEFIPVLEETGAISEVGAWVLRTALYQAAQWRKLCPDFHISVNASYVQLSRPDFKEIVIRELELSGLPPEALILELTESCKITDPERLKEDLRFFEEHQIQVALDDFGTGYSSIAMLRQLTPSWIKIDHTFVASITESKLDQAIIEYILQLCKHAGIHVCIEGVETAEILRIVRQYQPEILQGYYFSRPLTPEEFVNTQLKKAR